MTASQELRELESQLSRTTKSANTFAEALRRVEEQERRIGKTTSGGSGNIPNAGGGNVPGSGGKPADYVLRGMGFYTPQSAGSDIGNLNRFAAAAKQAEQAIKQAYSEGAKSIEVFDRKVEATTGHVVVQAKVTRDLVDAQGKAYGTQTFTATSTVNPFDGKQTQYTSAQQAFANQAGGIDKANQALSKYGLQLQNVTGFYKDLNSNVARFSVVGTDGVAQAMGNMDQFGNATIHASRNAQTLAQNVGRNVEKVVEWAIATTLLYTVMNSLMQAGKELQDIEETMLDIQIATGAAGDELNRYYDAALAVANITGSDVTETLEAQAKAYRAAGSEADRFGTANVLLRDSMILSRIAGIDQAKALDTLVAALRQTGNELTEGTTLLDKWVATSKVIGVSVEDLAESFAITADVATTVGVTIDELNGIIGVLAEKTTLSGTEVGNAARTMFAGITSDEAVSTLGEFGIAVRTVSGDMRDWMDINQDVVDMINAGILNDEQINKLANAIGGGSRRGPQLITLWRNFGAVSTVAGASMNANGEAAAAMEIKLDSLQAALNELHNAFNELVQTLGYDGGFLELMTDLVKISTDVVNGLTDIADAFEDSATSVTGMVIAYMALKRILGTVNLAGIGGGPLQQAMINGQMTTTSGSRVGSAINYLGTQAAPGTAQAGVQGIMGAGGAIALGEVMSGIANDESWDRVGARAGAAITGAFVGNMLMPGVGGLIGSLIADYFVKGIQNQQDAFEQLASGSLVGESPDKIQSAVLQAINGPLHGAAVIGEGTGFSDEEIVSILERAFKSGLLEEARGKLLSGQRRDVFEEGGFTGKESAFLSSLVGPSGLLPEQLELVRQGLVEYNKSLTAETEAHNQLTQLIPTTTLNQASLLQGPQGAALRSSFASQESQLYQQAGRSGNVEDYNKRTSAMKQIETATAAVANAQYGLNVTTEQYVGIGNLLLNTTNEQRDKIILLASGINDTKDKIEALNDANERGWDSPELAQLLALLEQYNIELGHTVELTEKFNAIQFARDNYISPTAVPTDQNGNPLTKEQAGYSEALDAAYKAQDEYAQYLGIDPQALRDSVTEPLVLAFADGYTEIKGLTSDFSKDLMDKMKETAEAMKEEISFSFKDMRDVNIDPGALDQRIKYYENVMKQYEPYGYKEDKQNIGILGEGNQVRVLNTTMTALNLAIEDLTEVEKKQLEGQWNLPSGATAYVPINSLFESSGGSGGMGAGGIGESTGIMIDQGATKIDLAANKMLDAAEAMRIRDINSARWEGLGAQYARNAETKPTEVEVDTNVTITPANTILTLDGRIINSAMQKYLAEGLSTTSRTTPGAGPTIT